MSQIWHCGSPEFSVTIVSMRPTSCRMLVSMIDVSSQMKREFPRWRFLGQVQLLMEQKKSAPLFTVQGVDTEHCGQDNLEARQNSKAGESHQLGLSSGTGRPHGRDGLQSGRRDGLTDRTVWKTDGLTDGTVCSLEDGTVSQTGRCAVWKTGRSHRQTSQEWPKVIKL